MKHTGSERRLLAFLLVVLVIAWSPSLSLDGSALTALTTVTLGYLAQGSLKEAQQHKEEQVTLRERRLAEQDGED
jgi:hypothetical protein